MKNIVSFLVFFWGISLFEPAFAADYEKLLTIINTEDNEPATLYLRLNQGEVSGLKLITTKYTSHFNYSDVESGTTLLRKSGISIVSVKGISISPSAGGALKLTYLKNFSILGSSYGTININVIQGREGWKMLYQGHEVVRLHMTPHKYGISAYWFN